MKFEKLTISNFLTIGSNAELNLADKGLVLVQGVNEDDGSANSNGAGKSSIADALSWVLYGVTARGVTGDAVVNRAAKKDCFVSVTITDGASVYVVTRFRKHKDGKNSLRLDAIDPAKGIVDLSKGTDRETQELVERILGCSYDVFKAAVYSGQEQMPDLPGMTDKNLKLLIEEAAGIERIQRAYEIAREKARESELARATNAAKHDAAKKLEASIAESHRQLLTDHGTWLSGREARTDAARESERQATERFMSHAGTLKGADRAGLVKQRDEKKEALQGYEKTQAELKTLRASIAQQGRTYQQLEFQLRQLANERTAAQNAIDNVDVEMSKPCQACGKPHTAEERHAWLLHQTQRLTTIVDKARPVAEQFRAAKAQLDTLQQQEATLQATPAPTALLQEIEALNAEIIAFDRALDLLRQLKQAVVDAKQNVERVSKEESPYLKLIETATEKLTAATAEVGRLDTVLAESERDRDELAAAVKVFGPAGVRAHILDTVTPFLNERTAEYLSLLTDGNMTAVWSTLTRTKAGELKEKFCIEVTNKTGAETFTGLSGGEKRKVRLACMLALQDLVASRAVKPIDLFVADEIDDALDASGLERLMTVLDRRAKERGTVLVVSHNELKDWCDEITTVTKSGGYAKIGGALCL